MKKTNNAKKLLCAGLAVCMGLGTAMTAMAGTWRLGMAPNENRWWYDFDNGSYAIGWHWIDRNQDGIAECYYFDESGWMLAGTTTPDGYVVNADGAWVADGQVQAKAAEVQQPENTQEQNIYGLYECHTEYLDAELEVGVYTGDNTDYIRLAGSSPDGIGAGEFNGIVVSVKENNYTAVDEFGNVIDVYFDGLGNAKVTDGNTGLGGLYFPGFGGIYQMTADFSHAG